MICSYVHIFCAEVNRKHQEMDAYYNPFTLIFMDSALELVKNNLHLVHVIEKEAKISCVVYFCNSTMLIGFLPIDYR
jgi:hypothetical protein